MNLIHLIAKRDRNVVLGAGVRQTKVTHAGRTFGALALPVGETGHIRIRTLLRWYPFNAFDDVSSWLAVGRAGDWNAVRATPSLVELTAALVDPAGNTVAEQRLPVGFTPGVVHLPRWPATLSLAENEALDLVITNTSASGDAIDLLVTERVPPEPLYERARGLGVEIGPGPSPRILAAPGREVFYVERETAEDFKRKYSFTGRSESLDSAEAQAFWKQIILGRANELLFEDGSLDFVFSAHVIEHLVNPLGHLEYWRSKLKPGGQVLAIIPAITGCSDYVNRPTQIGDWLAQYETGGYVETPKHHRAYAVARGLSPEALMAKGFSSHFSFFTPQNLAQMLDVAVARLGYGGYHIDSGLNSKAIHFSVIAA